MKQKLTAYHLSMIAFSVVLNLIGGQLALLLRLPIYLDSIGTIFSAALLGPFYGMFPSLLSGVILGMTSDIYSLYYAPVGILFGFPVGLVWKRRTDKIWWPFAAALITTIPASFVSSCITAYLFGGITSSGSTILVQLLAKTPLALTMSCFVVQVITDYLDRILGFFIVMLFLKNMPDHLKRRAGK